MDKLRALHGSIESSSKPPQKVSKVELLAATKDGRKFLLHLLLASQVADLSHTEALFGMKRASQAFIPCHTCSANRKNFSYCISAKRRA